MDIHIDQYLTNNFRTISYESPSFENINLKLNEPWLIYQQNISIIKSKTNVDEGDKLFEIDLNDAQNYQIKFNDYDININPELIQIKNGAFFALVDKRINKSYNKYKLKEGDVIKLGKVFLKVEKIVIKIDKRDRNKFINKKFKKFNNSSDTINIKNNNLKMNMDLNLTNVDQNVVLSKKEEKKELISKEKICRICYCGETEEENPLIHPCSCTGSMKYIHFKCLKHWMAQNMFLLEENFDFYQKYNCKEPICELCQSRYPGIIIHKGKEYTFFTGNNSFNSYVIFEKTTFNDFDDDKRNKTLFVVSLDKANQIIQIGRGNDNDLIIRESSVSRNHCKLKVLNNKLFIEDIGSKYGTLILVQTPNIQLAENLELFLQIGNNFVKYKVYNPSLNSFFGCCSKINPEKPYDYYYKQNIIKMEENNNFNNVYKESSDNESELENKKEKKLILSEFEENKIKIERIKRKQSDNVDTYANIISPINNENKNSPEPQNEN